MNRATCDQHPRYRAGCVRCAKRSSRYANQRAQVITNTGIGFSRAADLTAQRLWELRAAGWNLAFIADHSGVDWHHLSELCRTRRYGKYVTLRVYDAVDKTYRELRDFRGPSSRARTWAAKAGHVPPEPAVAPAPVDESEIDEEVVRRAVDGERITMTRAESAEAWTRLEKRGMSANEIALLLHTTSKTVERWRSGETRRPASTRARADRSGPRRAS